MCFSYLFQALTNAERKRKYLDKLKANGQFDEFKKKKNAAEKCRLDRIKNGLELLPKAIREKTKRLNRAYTRKKVTECRQRKKNAIVSSEQTAHLSQPTALSQTVGPHTKACPYKTDSAISKAAAKLKRALPSTSEKKVAAVRKFLRCFNETEYQQIVCVETNSTSTRGIKPDVINLVKSFYNRDDISRISPNVRDCRKFKDSITGIKELKQIRYLMYRLSDAYSLFLQHIRKGNFASLESVILLCAHHDVRLLQETVRKIHLLDWQSFVRYDPVTSSWSAARHWTNVYASTIRTS